MNPYESLDEKSFWATAVARRPMTEISGLWTPRFEIRPDTPVATFGSCFAQHIGRALVARGFRWMNAEPAPKGLSDANARRFHYDVFSARTGNIYTVSLLRQWVGWALGGVPVPDEVWEQDGRFYDPFRPQIEPGGFASAEEMRRSRAAAVAAFRHCLLESELFVFTLGLTESWFHRRLGHEYPLCPGTAAGVHDPAEHRFMQQPFAFVRKALDEVLEQIRRHNPRVRFLLTVSPVPLTATMTGQHVLLATMEAKSTLRTAAAVMVRHHEDVDYFPSYELINGTPFRGAFFEANQRQVSAAGVEFVMRHFFAPLGHAGTPAPVPAAVADVNCDEELLGAFAPAAGAEGRA